MSSLTFARLEKIFHQAAQLEGHEREAFLASEAREWPDLAAKARDLLAADERLAGHQTARPVLSTTDAPLAMGGLEAGAQVGPFVIDDLIDEGGMGAVYRGHREDGDVEQRVAVKVMHGAFSDEAGRYRFRLESQVLARLEHPGISRFIDAGETVDGHPYLAMELIDGESITAYCRRHDSSLDERLALFKTACLAVAFAHRHLVVHRDLKPSHVLVDDLGAVKVIDFGIAKPLTASFGQIDVARTSTQARLFSPLYAAPEQIRGAEPSVATDVYGLGLVLYELLSGGLAFYPAEKNPRQLEDEILKSEPPAPSRRAAELLEAKGRPDQPRPDQLRGDLDSIVLTCLRKEPGRRYGTVAELIDDLDRYRQSRPVKARAGRWPYRLGLFFRRHRLPVLAAALIAAVAFTGLLVFIDQASKTRSQRDRAQQVTDFMISAFASADPSQTQGAEVTAAQILEQSLRQLEREPPGSAETAVELLIAIARVQANLGLGAESWLTLEKADEHETRGSLPPDLARRLHQARISAQLAQGENEVARDMARVALADGGLSDEDQLHYEIVVARSLYHGSDNEQARTAFEALSEKVRRQGLETTEAGMQVREGLGLTLEALGHLEQAKNIYREMLEDRRRLLPSVHPDLLDSLHLLQTVNERIPDYAAQKDLTEEIIQLTEQLYGEESLPQAEALAAFARIEYRLGNHASTVEKMQTALAIFEKRYGKSHAQVARFNFNLALYGGVDPAFADVQDRAFATAIKVGENAWPEDHLNLLLFRSAYALWLNEHDRFEEALATARRGLEVAEVRPELKEYDFYAFCELARAIAELKLGPSGPRKENVEHWLRELIVLPKDRLTKAKQQAQIVAHLGIEIPPEVAAAPEPRTAN